MTNSEAELLSETVTTWMHDHTFMADDFTADMQEELQNYLAERFLRIAADEREVCDRILADMQKESLSYLQGVSDALRTVHKVIIEDDKMPLDAYAKLQAALVIAGLNYNATIRPQENILIRCGSLEITMDQYSCGPITIDGHPVFHRGMTIVAEPGNFPEVTMKLAPFFMDHNLDLAEEAPT